MKTTKNFTISLSGLLLFLTTTVHAQIEAIKAGFEKYQQANLREKVFVHTDKGLYVTGDILWLKVYDVDAATNKPVDISKVVYIDVLDASQNPVMQAKIALSNGTGTGSLYIPVNLSNGNYKLRGYTSWMKNYGPEGFFEKKISIVNPLMSFEASGKATPDYDIQFFPEGGGLVAGVSNRVAFRIVGRSGRGANLQGALVDQRNDTISRFRPLKFGLGSFTFTPVSGGIYKVVFKEGNRSIVRPLPQSSADAYNMILANELSGSLGITVNSGRPGNLYLFGYSGKTVEVAQTMSPNNGTARFNIDKSKLVAGVTHFTIFNEAGLPVAERLYFKRVPHSMQLQVTVDKQEYTTRGLVNLSLAAAGMNSKPIATDLSLAVYRIDSLQRRDDPDIESYLQLASELKGNIEQPGYYFNHPDAATDEALDNLLLTQGWTQYDWKSIATNTRPSFKFLPEYNGHIVSARLLNAQTSAPVAGVVGYLTIPSTRVQLYTAISDSTGLLRFNTKEMYGPGEIILQTNFQKDSLYRIDVLTPFSEKYTASAYPDFQPATLSAPELEKYSLAMQVQNVYNGLRIKQFFYPQVDSLAFYCRPYKTYPLDDFTRFTTMEEVMREYVTEVNINRSGKHYEIKAIGPQGVIGFHPTVMVDGVPLFNVDKLFAMDPLKVRKLEVVANPYYYGPVSMEAIYSFVTYKGDLGGLELDPKAVVLDYEGMQLQRKFYSPIYETESEQKSHLPDFRTTLYWHPSAGTGADGKNKVSFYTSDQPGTYRVVVQGIGFNGETGYTTTTFEVKR